MTQTPYSDPTPGPQPTDPSQPQPDVSQPGTETEVGTDAPPDTEPDEMDH